MANNNSYPVESEEKVIEECVEVIHAIQKIKRFGLYNYHPHRTGITNKEVLLSEMKDLYIALDNMKAKWFPELLREGSNKEDKEE